MVNSTMPMQEPLQEPDQTKAQELRLDGALQGDFDPPPPTTCIHAAASQHCKALAVNDAERGSNPQVQTEGPLEQSSGPLSFAATSPRRARCHRPGARHWRWTRGAAARSTTARARGPLASLHGLQQRQLTGVNRARRDPVGCRPDTRDPPKCCAHDARFGERRARHVHPAQHGAGGDAGTVIARRSREAAPPGPWRSRSRAHCGYRACAAAGSRAAPRAGRSQSPTSAAPAGPADAVAPAWRAPCRACRGRAQCR